MDTLPPATRAARLLDPLIVLEADLRARLRSPHLDRPSLAWLGATAAALAVAFLTSSALAGSAAALLGAGLLASMATDVRRFVRRTLHRRLAVDLRPLQPTRDELAELVDTARRNAWELARHLDLQRLFRALRRLDAR